MRSLGQRNEKSCLPSTARVIFSCRIKKSYIAFLKECFRFFSQFLCIFCETEQIFKAKSPKGSAVIEKPNRKKTPCFELFYTATVLPYIAFQLL